MIINRAIRYCTSKGGELLIKGVVTKKGVPIICTVRAYSRDYGDMLSQSTSQNDGSYILFGSINSANYVVAIDPEEEFNLAAEDNIQ